MSRMWRCLFTSFNCLKILSLTAFQVPFPNPECIQKTTILILHLPAGLVANSNHAKHFCAARSTYLWKKNINTSSCSVRVRGNLGVISRISSRCLGLEPPAGRGDAACLLMPGLAAAPQSYVEPPQTHTPGLAAALQSCVEPPKCTCPRQGWQQPHSPAQAPPNAHTSAGSSPAILPAPPKMHTPGLAAAP